MITVQLEKAIAASRNWSDVAHTTFAELAQKHREDIIVRGDLTFIRLFREQFGIAEEPTGSYGLGGPTKETEFIKAMQPINNHFAKFARLYEQQRLLKSYLDMIRNGRKDELIALMQVEQERINASRRVGNMHADNVELQGMQKALQQHNQEEALRLQKEQQDQQRIKMIEFQEIKRQREIEAEAKRRIERENYEAAVRAKMAELR